jgi:hypothetical protein
MHSALITITSRLKADWAYVSGRTVALSSRPLSLLILNYSGGSDLSSNLALAYLSVALVMAFSGFDTHRSFYESFFGEKRKVGVREKYNIYCSSIVLQLILALPLLFVPINYYLGDLLLFAMVFLYFISEKFADETQRFLIFKGSRQEWGYIILSKGLIQISGIILSCIFISEYLLHLAVSSLILGNLVSYRKYIPYTYLKKFKSTYITSFKMCLDQKIFFILSIITTTISYIDRIVITLFQRGDLAFYTILVSCISIMQNAVDYFYVSMKRKEILQGKIYLRDTLFDRKFIYTIIISAAVGTTGGTIMIVIYNGASASQFDLVPIVLVGQLLLSITLLLREIIYWSNGIRRLVLIDFIFVMTSIITMVYLRILDTGYKIALISILILLIARLVALVWHIERNLSPQKH